MSSRQITKWSIIIQERRVWPISVNDYWLPDRVQSFTEYGAHEIREIWFRCKRERTALLRKGEKVGWSRSVQQRKETLATYTIAESKGRKLSVIYIYIYIYRSGQRVFARGDANQTEPLACRSKPHVAAL